MSSTVVAAYPWAWNAATPASTKRARVSCFCASRGVTGPRYDSLDTLSIEVYPPACELIPGWQSRLGGPTLNLDDLRDPFFGPPFVDIDEWRDEPVRMRYVHGGFADTDTRFSFYFPPAE